MALIPLAAAFPIYKKALRIGKQFCTAAKLFVSRAFTPFFSLTPHFRYLGKVLGLVHSDLNWNHRVFDSKYDVVTPENFETLSHRLPLFQWSMVLGRICWQHWPPPAVFGWSHRSTSPMDSPSSAATTTSSTSALPPSLAWESLTRRSASIVGHVWLDFMSSCGLRMLCRLLHSDSRATCTMDDFSWVSLWRDLINQPITSFRLIKIQVTSW